MIKDLFLFLAKIAYDIFYPMAILAQQKLGNLQDITYTNPFTHEENTIIIFGKDLIDIIVEKIGASDITVIQTFLILMASGTILIVIMNIIKWFTVND